MERRFNLSAKQMAMLSGCGGAILVSAFVLTMMFHDRFAALGWRGRLLFLTPPMLLGAFISIASRQRLKRGIQSGRWEMGEIEALRIAMESDLWRVLSYACLILFGITMIESTDRVGFEYVFIVVLQTITAIQTAVRRPQASGRGFVRGWRSFPGLRSDHWGER